MSKPRRKELPPPLTPEAREARKRFESKYEGLLRATQKIALNVLVWGQDPARKTTLARKRDEIRSELNRLGHNAMFSEEIPCPKSMIPTNKPSEKSKEFAQARAADLVIILVEDAPGASAEAHDFCNHPEIAPKTLVMIPKAYRHGYSAQGAIRDLENAFGNVFWYEPKNVEECWLLARAVTRAEALRNIYYRSSSGGI